MKKVFIALWTVVGLFSFGIFLAIFTAFTMHPTAFTGQANVHLKFVDPSDKLVKFTVTGAPIAADGSALVVAKFEARDTGIWDTFNNGPKPRTAVVSFMDDGGKRHEIFFRYDRHDAVWQAEISFPDPSLSDVIVEKSSLDFQGVEGDRRKFTSEIYARAVVGPPIIKND